MCGAGATWCGRSQDSDPRLWGSRPGVGLPWALRGAGPRLARGSGDERSKGARSIVWAGARNLAPAQPGAAPGAVGTETRPQEPEELGLAGDTGPRLGLRGARGSSVLRVELGVLEPARRRGAGPRVGQTRWARGQQAAKAGAAWGGGRAGAASPPARGGQSVGAWLRLAGRHWGDTCCKPGRESPQCLQQR